MDEPERDHTHEALNDLGDDSGGDDKGDDEEVAQIERGIEITAEFPTNELDLVVREKQSSPPGILHRH
jgi:hypothetical protein